jgi:prepilin-type N-terminal cleavage/methylation domain-containing protein
MKTKVRSPRSAFTLIELMVVITIIVALVALTASAVLKFIEVQQTNNTQSTLDRVQSQLARAWSKVKDEAVKEPIPPAIYAAIQSSLTMNDANAPERIRVIYVKLKLRAAFPMNFGEALNVPYTNPTLAALGYNPNVPVSPVPALPSYVSYLANHGFTTAVVSAQAAPQPYESSVCLLMALQRGASGAGIDPSQLTTGGAAGNINGMPYLTDAWGRPIFFSRAPAGSFYLNPAGSLPGANDPGDPQGYLQTAAWGQTYGPLFTQLTLQILAPANSSYKLAPMVASGGPANWMKTGTLPFNPITFAPVPGGGALFSTP